MALGKVGLGRGFDSLLPQNFDSSLLLTDDDRIQKLAVDNISPNAQQPRTHFDDEALAQLAASIKQYGILQPLVVTPFAAANGGGPGQYSIIAGERRWRASKLAGLTTVPVIVRSTQELEQLEIALVENVQRVDLSPLEQAVSIERLHQQFNMTYDKISERLGKALAPSIIWSACCSCQNLPATLLKPAPLAKAMPEQYSPLKPSRTCRKSCSPK